MKKEGIFVSLHARKNRTSMLLTFHPLSLAFAQCKKGKGLVPVQQVIAPGNNFW